MRCEFEVRDDVQVCVRCKRELPARIPNPLIGCRAHSKPGVITRMANVSKATAKWVAAGKPTRSPREVERLFTVCKTCDHFDPSDSTCDLCGCPVKRRGLRNKLRMATEGCPDKPPRFLPDWPDKAAGIDQITIGITAFNRPASLRKLVSSIRHRDPSVQIVVADNGNQYAEDVAVQRYLRLPFDCGLSAARNALVDAIDTPYLLLCEEDFEFRDDTQLETLLQILDHDQELGLVGGLMIGTDGAPQPWHADFDIFRGTLTNVTCRQPIRVTPEGTPYQLCDVVPNFFLARKQCLVDSRWDPDLKVCEHREWFLRLKRAGQWRVAHCDQVRCFHHRTRPTGEYRSFRQRDLSSLALKKMGLSEMRIDRREVATDRPNIIIGGIGHAGTSVVTEMLAQLGWELPGIDPSERYAEHVEFRRLNREAIRSGELDRDRAEACLRSLGQGWVIKEPQFCRNAQHWLPVLAKLSVDPVLVILDRDREALAESYRRRGVEHPEAVVESAVRAADESFATWPWGKLRLRYEGVGEAVGLWSDSWRETTEATIA